MYPAYRRPRPRPLPSPPSSPSPSSSPSSPSSVSSLSSSFIPRTPTSSRSSSFFSCRSSPSPPSSPPPLMRVRVSARESDGESSYGTDDDLCAAMATFDMSTLDEHFAADVLATPTRASCASVARLDKAPPGGLVDHIVSGIQITYDVDDAPVPPVRPSSPPNGSGKHYVVVKGYCPGIYGDWDTAEQYVKGVPHAKFKSFRDLDSAEQYFRRSIADNDVQALDYSPRAGAGAAGTSRQHNWIVVFSGVRPGVYKSWCEAAPNVLGVSKNHCLGYRTERDAKAAFAAARRDGNVHVRAARAS
ncbi:hypothetical protein PLICRDRAFT_176771 [Plicaturopsis crispa FD-325 SS-3]|nr:hypothetical protein PLICRDRAFT_176771 [Plicaturopsis crispa FD-325 SS-3]